MQFPTRSVATTVLLLALVLGTATTLLAGAIPQHPVVRISDAGAEARGGNEQDVVEKNGVLHAVWLDARDDQFSGIYYANSTDMGATWSQNRRVTQVPYDDWVNEPSIAVAENGDIWVLYHLYYNDTSDQLNDLVLSRSTDGGATFPASEQYRIFDGVNGDSDLWYSNLIANTETGKLNVLAQEYATSGSDEGMNILGLTVDHEAGVVTGGIISDAPATGKINDNLQDYGAFMSFAYGSGKLCAAWEDKRERYSIHGACSTDNGATYGANFRISPSDSIRPEIAIAPNGDLYVLYAHDQSTVTDLYLRRSTDNGATWGPERSAATATEYEIENWKLDIDANGQIVIAWQENGFGRNWLYLTTSLDQGESFAQVMVFPDTVNPVSAHVVTGGSGEDTWAYTLFGDGDDHIWGFRSILDGIPPSAPTQLKATGVERAIQLTWSPSSDANGVAGYNIYRAAAAAGPFEKVNHVPAIGTSYVDVELAAGASYFYQVRALDSTANRSGPSNTANATAAALGASTVTGLLAYEAADNVRIQNLASGETQTISDASYPLFSADGQRIYWGAGGAIHYRPVAGGSPTTFFEDPEYFGFDLAADQSHFTTIIRRTLPSMVTGGFCFLFEPRVGRPGQELYVSQFEYAGSTAISSDAKWAAYSSAGWCNAAAVGLYTPPRLCIVNVVAGEENCTTLGAIQDADFAPTGNSIVFASDLSGQMEIWRAEVTANGSLVGQTKLTAGPANAPSTAPAWSSDGRCIVFQRDMDPGDGESWQLHVVSAEGVGVRPLEISGESPVLQGGSCGIVPGSIKTVLPTIRK